MSQREPRRGGAIKGLAALLGLLVVLLVYLAWQDSISPLELPALLLAIPLWFYLTVLGVAVVFAAAFTREGLKTSTANGSRTPASTPPERIMVRSFPEVSTPLASSRPRPHKQKRVTIDFVPVAKPHKEVTSIVASPPDDDEVAIVSAEPKSGPIVNQWPTEALPLGKPPRERGTKTRAVEPVAPISLTPAIPEPYLGPELEGGPDALAGASVESPVIEAAPVTAANAPPDTLLGRLMNWLDETAPEAVAKPRKRRASSSKKHGR